MVLVSSIVGLCLAEDPDSPSTLVIPTLGKEWKPVAAFDSVPRTWPTDPATSPHAPGGCVIPLRGGLHGLFRRYFDGVTKSYSTRVYLSTKETDFGFGGQNAEAMHLVADLPYSVTKVLRHENKWYVIKSDMGNSTMTALKWKVVSAPRPASPGDKPIRVAIYDDTGSSGEGVPACLSQLSGQRDVQVNKLDARGIQRGLSGYHVVIFSGGSASSQANKIGLAGREQVRRFVEAGGGYVGICAGAYLACEGLPWGLKILNAKTPTPLWQRGRANLKIESTEAGRELLHLPDSNEIIYNNGPVLIPASHPSLAKFESLAFFRTEVSKHPSHKGLQVNTSAIARGRYGQGKVLVSSPHPEQTVGMERWIRLAVEATAPETR